MSFLAEYRALVEERAKQGIVPFPLNAEQTAQLVELLKSPATDDAVFLLELFENRIPAGVDEAAYVKASFLSALVKGDATSPLISAQHAVKLLGTMQGGYNIDPLLNALVNPELAPLAVEALSYTLLMFDNFHDVTEKAKSGNPFAKQILQSWANADWFLSRPKLAEKNYFDRI